MNNIQVYTDKLAIGLSVACTIHCLAFPLMLVLLPSFATLPLHDERFHLWMVVAVIPTSAYALTMGCRQHQRYHLLTYGLLGLACLVSALFMEAVFSEARASGELMEKVMTVLGAGLIAYGHYKNYRLCQQQRICGCSDPQ